MAHQVTNSLDVHAALEQPHCKRMTQGIGRGICDWKTTAPGSKLERCTYRRVRHWPVRRRGCEKECSTRTDPSTFRKIAAEQINCFICQRQGKPASRLVLLDTKRPCSPVDRICRQSRRLTCSQTILGHEVEEHEVAPTATAMPVDRVEELLNEIRRECPWRLITSKRARKVDRSDRPWKYTLLRAVVQKDTDLSQDVMKGVAAHGT